MGKIQAGGLYRVKGKLVDASGKPVKAEARRAAPAAVSSDLPEEFPGREHLIAAGLTTVAAVGAKSDEDLVALQGIGPATVRDIREALK